MPRFKDQAICLRLIDWSETSQIVALLCENHGKLRGLAKGSKRTSPGSVARFSGGIELLTLGQVVAVTKPTSQMATLTEWDLQEPYWHLRRNLRAHWLAMYAADLASALLADDDPHPTVFAALSQFLTDVAKTDQREQALLRYQWRLLADCGYRPQLDRDVRTDEPFGPRAGSQDNPRPGQKSLPVYVFDPRAGGFTAETSRAANGCWRVRTATVQLLRQVATDDPAVPDYAIEAGDNSADTVDRANRLLCVYVRAILDRQLPTMRYVLDPAEVTATHKDENDRRSEEG